MINPEKLRIFIEVCNQYNTKTFINSDINLAVEFGFCGIHLPSAMLGLVPAAKEAGLLVFASCHSSQEIDMCEKFGADMITLSPVFASPDKGEPLGVDRFDEMVVDCRLSVFALGGIIDEAQIEMVKNSKAAGFASIRYFIN